MSTNGKNIAFKGKALTVPGPFLKSGDKLPEFVLTATDMSDLRSKDLQGAVVVLSVLPSLDTPVCQKQTKRFNAEAASFGDKVKILTVSMDLPFAQSRWCGAEGIENVKTASAYKHRKFGSDYGVYIEELGLLARAVFVADARGVIRHAEYVPEISAEPDYATALQKIREALS